ncbi:MAG: hypothetical protein ACK53Y_09880, partial [bacterium]
KKIKDQASSISASDSISEDTLLKVMKENNIPEDIPQKVKKKIEAQASSLTTIDGSSENLLSQFSGEPQIVESFAISQFTPREPIGLVAGGSSLSTTPSTSDIIKGMYIAFHLLCIGYMRWITVLWTTSL